MDKKGLTVSEFIEQVFLTEYREIVNNDNLSYIAFHLIFSSIELLGKCLDISKKSSFDVKYDPNTKGTSYVDFQKAIDWLFPKEYHEKYLNFYDYCRCGFAHTVKPSKDSKISLGTRRSIVYMNDDKRVPNLCKDTQVDKYCLLLEDFYEDFSMACHKILKGIEIGKILNETKGTLILDHEKLTNIFLPVQNHSFDVK